MYEKCWRGTTKQKRGTTKPTPTVPTSTPTTNPSRHQFINKKAVDGDTVKKIDSD